MIYEFACKLCSRTQNPTKRRIVTRRGSVDDDPMWWFMSANAEAVGYKPVNMIPFRLHAVEGILWPCLPTTSTVAVALA